MKRLLLIGAALSSFAFGPSGHAEQLFGFGIGESSCGNWLSTPGNKLEGQVWVLGYWTGLNAMSSSDHIVGHGTDAEGVWASIQKVCDDDPTMSLQDATTTIYNRLLKDNR